MDEPRTKGRISIRAALATMFGLCIGFTMFADSYGAPVLGILGAAVFMGTVGAFTATLYGGKPLEGAVMAIGYSFIIVVLASIAVMALVTFARLFG